LHLRVPDLGVTLPKTHHLGYTPWWAGGKTPIAGAPSRDAHRRSTDELDGFIQVHCHAPQGTTFVFGSWVCAADGTGDFHRFIINIMKPKSLAASFHSELNEFVDNLDNLLTHGSARKIEEESVFNVTPPCAAMTTLESDSLQSEDLRSRSRLGLRNSATKFQEANNSESLSALEKQF
jgi:hypothetical protein